MTVDFDVSEHVATITINRPERMNAMDSDTYQALSDIWIRVRDDDDIRSAVVTGAGQKSFSAGADLKFRNPRFHDMSLFWRTQDEQILNNGLEVWKPVVAAVNGYCLAGGMTLLLATDIRIAVPHATFAVSEVLRGLLPANGGTQRIAEQLPYPIAMRLLLLGEQMSADEALRWGLINEVVEPEALLDRAQECAARFAALPPLAVQACKEMAVRSRDMDRTVGLRTEMTMLRMLQMTEDADEGKKAFAERREPVYRGR